MNQLRHAFRRTKLITAAIPLTLLISCGDGGNDEPATSSTASGGSATGGDSGASGGNSSSGGSASGGTTSSGSGGAEATGGMVATGGSVGTGGDSSTGGSEGNDEPVFHVFLLMGQSNMAGFPHADDADKVENPRIKVLGFDDCAVTGRVEGEWDVAAPPLHECWNTAIGPGDYFSKTLIEKYPEQDTIGLVPLAISGSQIEPFMKVGGEKYTWILERARSAQDLGGKIEGILFHQGESNCGSPAWPGQVDTLVSDLRGDLELGEVPFLAGELLYSGNCAQHNTRVRELPNLISNAHVVSAEGLAVAADDTWNLHFGHDAQVTFGKRYAKAMIDALGL